VPGVNASTFYFQINPWLHRIDRASRKYEANITRGHAEQRNNTLPTLLHFSLTSSAKEHEL